MRLFLKYFFLLKLFFLVNLSFSIAQINYVLPDYAENAINLRNWVRDSLEFYQVEDIFKIDIIYNKSLELNNFVFYKAIISCLYATFEHKNIPFSFGLKIPLTFESDSGFYKRIDKLPKHFFADKPLVDDKDKLQHFFASTLLAWYLDNPCIADGVGLFVEIGEDTFIKGGANDIRDIRANRLGHLFYELIKLNPLESPSSIFISWNKGFYEITK